MRSEIVLAILATAIATAPACAQRPIETLRVDGGLLRPGVDTFYTVVESGGRRDTLGRGIQSWAHVSAAAGAEWVQAYRWEGRDGDVAVDTVWMDARTLAPRREARGTPVGSVEVMYAGRRVRAAVQAAEGAANRVDTTFAEPVYASAQMDVLARALPLREGYSASVALYYPYPARVGQVNGTLRVLRREPCAGSEPSASGAGDCWVVELATPIGGPTRFWIEAGSRGIWQFSSVEGPTTVWFRR